MACENHAKLIKNHVKLTQSTHSPTHSSTHPRPAGQDLVAETCPAETSHWSGFDSKANKMRLTNWGAFLAGPAVVRRRTRGFRRRSTAGRRRPAEPLGADPARCQHLVVHDLHGLLAEGPLPRRVQVVGLVGQLQDDVVRLGVP